jgi:hypothetical protein
VARADDGRQQLNASLGTRQTRSLA